MSNIILHKHLIDRVSKRENKEKIRDISEFIRLEFNRLTILEKSGNAKNEYSREGKYVIQDKLSKIVYYRDTIGRYVLLTYIRKNLGKSFKIKKR